MKWGADSWAYSDSLVVMARRWYYSIAGEMLVGLTVVMIALQLCTSTVLNFTFAFGNFMNLVIHLTFRSVLVFVFNCYCVMVPFVTFCTQIPN